MNKNFLVTGRPGIGKTTCLRRAAEILLSRNVVVGGMLTLEVREGGIRQGFQIIDLISGRKGKLADVNLNKGPRVGKYWVNLQDLEEIGVTAIRRALREAKVVIIDEIGPMELFSEAFREAVTAALDSPKPVLASIHFRARESTFGRMILSRPDVEVVELTISNREQVPVELARKIAQLVAA
ncbi:MAG: NTPase [Infirmifilum sp.]